MALFVSSTANNVLWFVLEAFGFPHGEGQCCWLIPCDLGAQRRWSVPCACCICGSVGSRAQTRQVGERGCLQQGPSSCSQRGTTSDAVILGCGDSRKFVSSLQLTSGSRTWNQRCCHRGVFLSSVTHALSLPLSTIYFFKILAATNSMLFCSYTFWLFKINKTTKPHK